MIAQARKIKQYELKEKSIRCVDRLFHGYLQKSSFYGKREILNETKSQNFIADAVLSGKPFMAGRFGSVELRCIAEYDQIQCGLIEDYSDKTYSSMKNNAGFFPADREYFEKFAETMQLASRQVDLLGIWYNKLESYYVDEYLPDAKLTQLRYLEPYYSYNPWSKTLKGKKVLVVHPFSESIKKQYEKRENLFENSEVLPKFELICYKAVQSMGGSVPVGFDSWFKALDFMHEEIKKINYDIAILGCGAYGFPLAARIKKDGKQAIHLGGATQILFGIKGKRWDNNPIISKLYNKYWVRPSDEEKIENFQHLEGGCYW